MRSPRAGAMSPKRRRALARLGILLLLVGLIWSTQPNKRLGARYGLPDISRDCHVIKRIWKPR